MNTFRILVITVCVIGGGAIAWATRVAEQAAIPQKVVVTPGRTVATEQEWIVGDVVRGIAGIARNGAPVDVAVTRVADVGGHSAFDVTIDGDQQRIAVVNHLWSPDTFMPLAQHLLGDAAASDRNEDLGARASLTNLRTDVLLAQNRRISEALTTNLRSASAHQSAALLVGALALRESSNFFSDLRPLLSRMTAHLAVAQALGMQSKRGRDGALAMVLLTNFAGLQREALDRLDTFARELPETDPDQAWVRALRLRITGDWRQHGNGAADTLLERLEYARAVRERLGIDAFLDFTDTVDARDRLLPDWYRLALHDSELSVEAGHRFATASVEIELNEARHVWAAFHTGDIEREALVIALNDQPAPAPVSATAAGPHVDVLDWGTWAAFQQRMLLESLALNLTHAKNLGIDGSVAETLDVFDEAFGRLTLYPVVEGWIAENHRQYEDALVRARPIVSAHPELFTAAEWNHLLKKPAFVERAVPFPVNVGWFDPAVPDGTAFNLQDRSLQPGCPRPPTLEQAAWFARAQPYDEWTVWASAWYPVKGKPSAKIVRAAFGRLMEYDDIALRNFVGYIDLTGAERLELLQRRCDLDAGNCVSVAGWLLLENRERDAATMYERYIADARNDVAVSQNLQWIVRYYRDHGRAGEAEALALKGSRTQSRAGLETLADLLDDAGRYKEAEQLYREIAAHYSITAPLGTFLARRAFEAHDKALEIQAFDLLRRDFPNGVERVPLYALPARPTDGVQFGSFGRRIAAFGLEPDDIIVAVDGWRVHNSVQEGDAWRLGQGENVSFVVWRSGRYREVQARVPQRWLGATFRDYR